MIAAKNLVMDGGILNRGSQSLAHQEVVNAPTCIVLARVEALTPPRIRTFQIGMQRAERIHKPRIEQIGEFTALLIGKARGSSWGSSSRFPHAPH